MSLANSPYVGTWKIDGKKLVQHTPDALVYLNGDTALPGCPKCHRRIDLQQFLTEVTVDSGTDPSSASSSFTLSIPAHHSDSFARDAKFILRPGLEVHVYMRGYFPVGGMFAPLATPQVKAEVKFTTKAPQESAPQQVVPEQVGISPLGGAPPSPRIVDYTNQQDLQGRIKNSGKDPIPPKQFVLHESLTRNAVQTVQALIDGGTSSHFVLDTTGVTYQLLPTGLLGRHVREANSGRIGMEIANVYDSARATEGQTLVPNAVWAKGARNNIYAAPSQAQLEAGWGTTATVSAQLGIPIQFPAISASGNYRFGRLPASEFDRPGIVSHGGLKDHEDGQFPVLYMALRARGFGPDDAYKQTIAMASSGQLSVPMPNPTSAAQTEPVAIPELGPPAPSLAPKHEVAPKEGPSLLDSLGMSDTGIDEVIAYPYYHVFHGVTTQVTFNYASGVTTATVACSSLLHFWGHQQISDNASFLGARPTNSKLKMSIVGSNFTGKHPYQVIWELYSDIGGAAAGVGWALRQATNQDATAFNGESLFSLALNYWEKRFRGRINGLRLHAATGGLLSNAQAAYLSQTPTDKLVQRMKNLHSEAARTGKEGNTPFGPNNWQMAMRSKATLTATLLSQQGSPNATATEEQLLLEQGKSPRTNINMAEQQPWPMDLGKMGQVETFESTYVSKLDVAQKCMEVSGFEFYQDVDGDFVFKPPMYNLDTSASRVYRIEDIDLISINFSEKEPVATYIIAKGQHWRNWVGTGLENEWGVEGRYIDYRLVAQFGWRPASLESAYFNDPKALFFAGVNRLDIMNAATNSASVTIPLRPEIRPGYPFYIPYIDCFYYCPSFAHSFSVGGQCQTTLQLVAKRAKFYAPGKSDPTSRGIDAIDLSNPNLPERPLEVIGEDGRPRLSGFPNVVMALDPTHLNPLFFLLGTDIEDLGNPQVIQNLLDKAIELKVLKQDKDESGQPAGPYYLEVPAGVGALGGAGLALPQKVHFNVQGGTEVTNPTKAVGDGPREVDALSAGRDYTQDLRQRGVDVAAKDAELRVLDARILEINNAALLATGDKQEALYDLLKDKPAGKTMSKAEKDKAGTATSPTEKVAANTKAQIDREGLTTKRTKLIAERDALVGGQKAVNAKTPGLAYLINLIDQAGAAFRKTDADGGGTFTDLSSTANLLDLLSDKKAIFSNGQQPGYYRYYSASHPVKEMQGQKFRSFDSKSRGTENDLSFLSDPVLDDKAIATSGYLKSPTATYPNGQKPDAQLAENQPVTWGIRVNTFNKPKGEVLATSQIREVMFARHEAGLKRPQTDNKKKETPKVKASQDYTIKSNFTLENRDIGRVEAEMTVESVFKTKWDQLAKTYLTEAQQTAAATMKVKLGAVVPSITVPEFPSGIVVRQMDIDVKAPMSFYYPFPPPGEPPFDFAQALATTLPTAMDLMGAAGTQLGKQLSLAISAARAKWKTALAEVVTDKADQQATSDAFDLAYAAKIGSRPLSGDKTKKKSEFTYDLVYESPVFPVSDEKGYHVFGSYQYGRGIDIDPQGAFDALHRIDPTSMLSRKLVENINKALVDPTTQTYEWVGEVTENGQTRLKPMSSTDRQQAITGLEKQARREVSKDATNQNLLDMGILRATGDPNVLEFNLNNFIPDKNKDALMKVPLVNAAYSLADLTQAPLGHVCSCKAAEAGVQLEAFGQAEFLQIIDPKTVSQASQDSPDQLTKWLGQVTAEKVDSWRDQQAALRGTVLDNRGSNLVQAWNDVETSTALKDITDDTKRIAAESSFKTEQAISRIKKAFGGENT